MHKIPTLSQRDPDPVHAPSWWARVRRAVRTWQADRAGQAAANRAESAALVNQEIQAAFRRLGPPA